MTENGRRMSITVIVIAFIFPPVAFLIIPMGVLIRKWLNRQYYSNMPHVPKYINIKCTNCKTKNRVKTAYLNDNEAKCGKCGKMLIN